MSLFTVYVLGSSKVSVSGGGSLSGYTQGDAAHLMGKTLTLNAPDWVPVSVSDDDGFFSDNDTNQVLNGAQTVNGVTYASGRIVEAEYTLTVRAPNGAEYKVIGFNINEPNSSHASYGTIEGLAFVGPPGSWPPVGTPLTVVARSEGPPNSGTGAVQYQNYVAPICFATGTLLYTPAGPRPVEALRPGDLVLTRDHGVQPLVWTGHTPVGGTPREGLTAFRPVRLMPGSMGPGLPVRPLFLSRQHKVLLAGADIDLLFGSDEVLAPVVALAGRPGIGEAGLAGDWGFHHLLCDEHEILFAEGLPVESFHPGILGLSILAPEVLIDLYDAVPRLARGAYGAPARPVLKPWEARALAGAAARAVA